ncbi:GTP-binding protein YqeH [Spiroplasma sabaudiense Ar-1343]|uniref:GTP-binding protein YqeH n=1 Tax=Spiroplasma sabaudiense Ar-1343 TaxID=1276257 RepID=W6A9R2_9MOLU|nr:ribosome biogenesis GTPase YqeH [Spiroplasma sabaudiense]AHI53913.1 GTP-binding protein YqeH [Spiroplasma sabaudiense Ar-1343]
MTFFKKDKAKSASESGKNNFAKKGRSKVALKETDANLGNTTNQNKSQQKKCVGCGHVLHVNDSRKPGFVKDIEVQDYCLRCFKIKYYNSLVEQEINDKDFIDILDNINKNNAKIRYYYVIDIYDLPGSRISWLEALIATKEVVIVVNKIDLLPKSVKSEKIINYVKQLFESTKLKGAPIFLMSSFKSANVNNLLQEILTVKYDQYVVGISNAGKSSLINALLKANNQISSIVASKYVNTTLDRIKINFTESSSIYDTPGLVKHNHIATATAPSYWDFFFFAKEIHQKTYQLEAGQTIFYGGIAWVTFKEGMNPQSKNRSRNATNFHFYVNRNLPLHRTKAVNSEQYFKKNRHILAPRLTDNDMVFESKEFTFKNSENIDLHISGLGWINFNTYPGLKIVVYFPKTEQGIKVTLLPAII